MGDNLKDDGVKDLDKPQANGGDKSVPTSPDAEALSGGASDKPDAMADDNGKSGEPESPVHVSDFPGSAEAIFFHGDSQMAEEDDDGKGGAGNITQKLYNFNRFDADILIVDDTIRSINLTRRTLEETFNIDQNSIHQSTTRTEALNVIHDIKKKLLLISDMYTHTDIDTVKFFHIVRAIKKDIYIVLCTGKIERALREVPELDPSKNDLVDIAIDRYHDLKSDLVRVFNNFSQSRHDEIMSTHDKDEDKGETGEGLAGPQLFETRPPASGVELGTDIPQEEPVAVKTIDDKAPAPALPAVEAHVEEPVTLTAPQPSEEELPSDDKTAGPAKTVDETPTPEVTGQQSTSEVALMHSWEDVKKYAPEEVKQTISMEISEIYEMLKELSDKQNTLPVSQKEENALEIGRLVRKLPELREQLNLLGGDTEEKLKEVSANYDPSLDSDWHARAFGYIEKEFYFKYFQILKTKFNLNEYSDLIVHDFGVGTGRSLIDILDMVKEKVGLSTARNLVKNLHGIDLFEKNCRGAVKNLSKFCRELYGSQFTEHNFPSGNIKVGNFHGGINTNFPKHGRAVINFPGLEEKAHFVICMMRTSFHNVTEKDWINFLKNISDSLRPGGVALIDTVPVRRISPSSLNDPQVQSQLDDLKNFYTQLFLKYCRENQEVVDILVKKLVESKDIPAPPGDIDLAKMPRRHIFDNTTGKGFYWREVTNANYIQHLLDLYPNELDFTMAKSSVKFPRFDDAGKAYALGRKWLKDNELEEHYKKIINERLDSGLVKPEELLKDKLDSGLITPEELLKVAPGSRERIVDALLDYVALHIVRGFGAHYIVLQKVDKAVEDGADRLLGANKPSWIPKPA